MGVSFRGTLKMGGSPFGLLPGSMMRNSQELTSKLGTGLGLLNNEARRAFSVSGVGERMWLWLSKLKSWGYAGFGPCFHLPGF